MPKQYLKIFFLVFFTILVISCHDTNFDSKKWKNWDETSEADWHLRWDMTNDLMNNHNLLGKDTTYVFELLGKATVYSNSKKYTASYNLGPCRKGINYGSLEITFINGKVAKFLKYCM